MKPNENIKAFEFEIAQIFKGRNNSNRNVRREKRVLRRVLFHVGINKPYSTLREAFDNAIFNLDRHKNRTCMIRFSRY